MIKVGITGEMGSGKSYCCKLFEKLGVPVFYSDDAARKVINTNSELKSKIISEFGDDVYDSNGVMVPEKIRSIVFVEGGENKLKTLNKLTHSYVFEEFNNFCEEHKDKKYTISESAILFETGFNKNFSKTIYVYTPENIRIKRAFDRSGFSENEYKERMKNQIPSEIKRNWATFIIENYDNKDVESQVRGIDKKLLSL